MYSAPCTYRLIRAGFSLYYFQSPVPPIKGFILRQGAHHHYHKSQIKVFSGDLRGFLTPDVHLYIFSNVSLTGRLKKPNVEKGYSRGWSSSRLGAFRFYEENLHNVMILQIKYIVICKCIFHPAGGWHTCHPYKTNHLHIPISHKTDHLYAKSTKHLRAKNYGFNICFIEEIDPFSLEKPVKNQCVLSAPSEDFNKWGIFNNSADFSWLISK
jgi:hypothetical protein